MFNLPAITSFVAFGLPLIIVGLLVAWGCAYRERE